MIGAIIGDIVGSTYEFHNTHDYNFNIFPVGSSFTDDTVCTIAVADAILKGIPYRDSLLDWCRKYPHPKGAYGASFSHWINSPDPQPYDSFGNGAAMRVSPIGWAFNDPKLTLEESAKSAKCSHSHEEGINGAQTIASAIYLLRKYHNKDSKKQINDLCKVRYGDDYRNRLPKEGQWDETCQGCVPLAMYLFSIVSCDFEDAIRVAVSYGGDSDTLAAIVGSLAGAYFEIPANIYEPALDYLPNDMLEVVYQFTKRFCPEAEYLPYLTFKTHHNE